MRVLTIYICLWVYRPKWVSQGLWVYWKAKAAWWFLIDLPLEIQVWKQTFLVQRILCWYGRTQQNCNSKVHTELASRGSTCRTNVFERIHWPVHGWADKREQIKNSRPMRAAACKCSAIGGLFRARVAPPVSCPSRAFSSHRLSRWFWLYLFDFKLIIACFLSDNNPPIWHGWKDSLL